MTLTLLAHGSPDPRHARDVSGIAARLRLTDLDASVAYLDHDSPSPRAAARALSAAGATTTTVVPLLIAPAFHARVDVPAAIHEMRAAAPGLAVGAADPVGLHPLVLAGAGELVVASGLPVGKRTGIILAAAGSRDPRAVAEIDALVRRHGPSLAESVGAGAVRAAYLDGGRPLGRIRTLMRCLDGCTSFLVVTLMVADGILRDRIVSAAGRADIPVVPGALAQTQAIADLVLLRAGAGAAPLAGTRLVLGSGARSRAS